MYTWGLADNGRLGCDTDKRVAAMMSLSPDRRSTDVQRAPHTSNAKRQTLPYLLDALTHGAHANHVVSLPVTVTLHVLD